MTKWCKPTVRETVMNHTAWLFTIALIGGLATNCKPSLKHDGSPRHDAGPSPAAKSAPDHGSADDPDASPRFAFPSSALSCDEEGASAVHTWLTTYYDWVARVRGVPEAINLVKRSEPPVNRPSDGRPAQILVYLDGENLRLSGKPTTFEQFAERYEEQVKRSKREAQLLGRPWAHPGTILAIGAHTPWTSVVRLVAALSGAAPLSLGFHEPRPPELGSPPAPLMEEINGHYRVTGRVESPRHAKATAGCDAMSGLFRGLEKLPPGLRDQTVAERLGKTWVACGCSPDIEWLVGRQLDTLDVPVSDVPIVLSFDGRVVSHPGDARWADVYRSVVDAEGAVTLAIEE